jgi:branched-chain amino acid transport system substrate-binding protein
MRSLIPALFAAAALLSGCEKKQSAPAPAAPAPEAKAPAGPPPTADVILLGEVGSLTGAEATFGQSTHEGIQLALEQANAAGGVNGKKLEVRTYDDQGKPEEAANAAVRLINQDKVKLILGEVASTNSLAMADKAQAARVPMVSPSSTNEAVTQKGDYVFRVCFIDPFQGYAMAKFARESLKLQNVAVLQDNKSAYSTGLTGVFQLRFAEMGGKVAGVESYSKGDTDFRAQLTALKKARPDGIYIPGYYTDVGLIARQAQELGLKAVLLGGDGWESEKLFELGGSAVDGSYYTNHYSPDSPNPATQAFIAAYKAKFNGKVPDSLAALAFDAANVAVAALRKGKSLDGPDVRDALAQTKDFDGAAGKLTLDEKRNATKPAVVLKVENGKAVYAASVSP